MYLTEVKLNDHGMCGPNFSTSGCNLEACIPRTSSLPFYCTRSPVTTHRKMLEKICRRCLRAAVHSERARTTTHNLSLGSRRTISSTTVKSATVSPNHATQSAPRQGSPSSSHNPPAATSTSAAQPFSSPLTPSAKNQDLPIAAGGKVSAPPTIVKSSVPAGTILKGLNFMKGQQDPVALEDAEYPQWLWSVLGEKEAEAAAGGVNEGDIFCKDYYT